MPFNIFFDAANVLARAQPASADMSDFHFCADPPRDVATVALEHRVATVAHCAETTDADIDYLQD